MTPYPQRERDSMQSHRTVGALCSPPLKYTLAGVLDHTSSLRTLRRLWNGTPMAQNTENLRRISGQGDVSEPR